MNFRLVVYFSLLLVGTVFLFFENTSAALAPQPSFNLSAPDLEFINLKYKLTFISSSSNITYWNVALSGNLKNNGNAPASSSGTSMNICRNYGNVGSCFGQLIITPSVSPGGSTRVRGNFIGYSGQYWVGFRADTLNVIFESNETNNLIGQNITLP